MFRRQALQFLLVLLNGSVRFVVSVYLRLQGIDVFNAVRQPLLRLYSGVEGAMEISAQGSSQLEQKFKVFLRPCQLLTAPSLFLPGGLVFFFHFVYAFYPVEKFVERQGHPLKRIGIRQPGQPVRLFAEPISGIRNF